MRDKTWVEREDKSFKQRKVYQQIFESFSPIIVNTTFLVSYYLLVFTLAIYYTSFKLSLQITVNCLAYYSKLYNFYRDISQIIF